MGYRFFVITQECGSSSSPLIILRNLRLVTLKAPELGCELKRSETSDQRFLLVKRFDFLNK